MFRNRYVRWGTLFFVLLTANILLRIYLGWGLITVKVHDTPLAKVVSSIEWQGWVKICTNVPLDTKVTMYVDHVPLAEAMETLVANVSVPAPPDQGGQNGGPGGAQGGGQRPGGGNGFGGGGRQGGDGQGGGPPGGGGGGGNRNATWNLAFFVGPSRAAVKEEINAFQADTLGDDIKIYNFPTPLQMVATDDDMPAADPRRQNWPGMTPALSAPPPAPPVDPNAPPGSGPATVQANPPDPGPPTVQTYLEALAKASNIWILSPGSWAPEVPTPPSPTSSIASAVKNLVYGARGAVTEVIVLRVGRGGARGGRGGFFADMDVTQQRIDNAINGLPEEYQAPMRSQLQDNVRQIKAIQIAPPDQQPGLFRDFMRNRRNADNSWRQSPEKRAQRYARIVSNRQTAQGKQ